MTLLAKKQPDTNTRLAAERQEVARINQRDAELDAKLNAALLAGDNTAVDKLEAEIATLRREVERRHRTIVLLEKENVAEQTAAAKKRKEQQAECVLALAKARIENGGEIEKTYAKLINLVQKDTELSGQMVAGWPWSNSDVGALKPFGQGIRELMCYESYRQSALAFMDKVGGNAIALPGSGCPKIEWRLQPSKIPSLVDSLREIAAYASRAMHGTKAKPKLVTIEEKAEAS